MPEPESSLRIRRPRELPPRHAHQRPGLGPLGREPLSENIGRRHVCHLKDILRASREVMSLRSRGARLGHPQARFERLVAGFDIEPAKYRFEPDSVASVGQRSAATAVDIAG